MSDIIQQVAQKHCPDKRVSVFQVAAQKQSHTIIVTGEVLSGEAKSEVVNRIQSETDYEVADSIKVLPDDSLNGKIYGVIKVSVAQVRRNSDVYYETISQATMGAEVKVLKRRGGFWVYCQLEDDYLGWLMESALVTGDEQFIRNWRSLDKVIVTATHDQIWEQPQASGKAVSDAVWGNVLIDRGSNGNWRKVELADGRSGYIPASSVMDLKKMEQVPGDPEIMVELAYRFIGIPYFWGGRSTKGFDCSGFTQTLYKSIGIQLPRDANMQVKIGEEVAIDDQFGQLKTGDLLFFGKSIDKITHVGFYLGDQKLIHSDGRVKINSFNPQDEDYSEYRRNGLQAVRRILNEKQTEPILEK
ncbi:MAG: NlpC/P60 family protein [Candidatus Zhuqueibacterota bacterium]